MNNYLQKASWVGLPDSEIQRCNILAEDMTGRFTYFTKVFSLKEHRIVKTEIAISASSRYRLWINGSSVHSGPEKGNQFRYYYDVIDIAPYLKQGENLIAVQVLYQDVDSVTSSSEERSGIYAVINPGGGHRLLVAGAVTDVSETVELTTGVTDWNCYLNDSYYLTQPDPRFYFLGAIEEHFETARQVKDWREDAAVSADWVKAVKKEIACAEVWQKNVGFVEKFVLRERDIPLMYEHEGAFIREMSKTGILANRKLIIKANQKENIILDAGYIQNTYPAFTFDGGKGAKVTITYYEKHQLEGTDDTLRDDVTAPVYCGVVDSLVLDGTKFVYEPFWVRTFRFVQIEVETTSEEASISAPAFLKTGYPVTRDTTVSSSDEWVQTVFEMCTKTLEACMTETYMDSPHYEQMQYPMDTRLQMLFNETLSNDIDLVRKALHDFHDSITPWGILPGKAPTAYLQIISTFSLHYIFALWEYYWHTGDVGLLKTYRSDLDRILDYYEDKMNPEYGLIDWIGWWPFVDWQDAWSKQSGVPVTKGEGPSTIINLMYGSALLAAANIMEATGRSALAEEYRHRQKSIVDAVNRFCYVEETGLYKDGPKIDQYSLHAQSWAVLNEAKQGKEAANLMELACTKKEQGMIVPISFSTSYEFFRACEKVGRYDLTYPYMKQWIDLIPLHCMTCPETPTNSRSDCHAWSALPMYELVRTIGGVKAESPVWESVIVSPKLDYMTGNYKGKICTPKGDIAFTYEKTDGEWNYHVEIPEGMTGRLVFPDGTSKDLNKCFV